MLLEKKYIPQFEKFEIFVSTRSGGRSKGNYSEMNLGEHVGDDLEKLKKNRELLAYSLWKRGTNFKYMDQVHAADIHILREEDPQTVQKCDGIITDVSHFIPVVMVADCVPIVVFDSKNGIFGAIHSGWKGTAKNIVGETIRSMQSEFGSNASDIEVIIGPCISQDSYEVDDTVTQHFSNEYYEKNTNGGFQLNLRSVIVDQCQKAGCKEDNLYHIDIDSFTNPDLFFSARRDGYKTGRFIMGIYKK